MKTRIYMSHELKKARPNLKRIAVVQRGRRIRYTGPLRIVDRNGRTLVWLKFSARGMRSAPRHRVRAWLETGLRVCG